jgi:hypothetical protein
VQQPRADAEAQDRGALALDPQLVVRGGARAGGDLEDGRASGEGDADESRAGLGGKRGEASLQEMAELEGVLDSEGREGE